MTYDYEYIKQLAKKSARRVADLLALAPQNDPFYTGTETDLSIGNWFTDLYTRAGFSENHAPHLRRIHYWTVSQSPAVLMVNGLPYENTLKCWEYLQVASKAARYLGLVPMAGIVDKKNPDPHINADYASIESAGYDINVPELTDPYVWIKGIVDANAQPYHLELWCEKSTMNDVLLPICRRYGVNLVTFVGEVTTTSVCVNLMQRIKDSGYKPTRIWYISDFDPAGNSMPVAMSRKIEFITRNSNIEYDVKVTPLALTADQVKQYRLPRIPIKETEKRAASFESAFGSGAVELDALEALYPGQLAAIVERTISPYYHRQAGNAVRAAREGLRQAVSARVQEVTDRYQEQIEALRGMIEELQNIEVDTEPYTVERYAPHVDETGDHWLFDSQRGYIDQITAYKVHKGKESTLEDIA